MYLSRRSMMNHAAAASLAFSGFPLLACAQNSSRADSTATTYENEIEGYGPLIEDKYGICDLPVGFTYKVISEAGETMSDGLVVPHVHDGMGCFAHGTDTIALVRNHELSPKHRNFGAIGMNGRLIDKLDRSKVYDFEANDYPLLGGTTTVIYNMKTRQVEQQFMSIIGTSTNCAGGQTPWGSWLTCEETVTKAGEGVGKDHGYVFEVPSDHKGLVEPVPIKAMGRFKHEATATDPRTGIVYLTEDTSDGVFYRYLPNDRRHLLKGGKLQALGFKQFPKGVITANVNEAVWKVGDTFDAVWIDLDNVESPDDDLRARAYKAGAAQFVRGEGIHFGDGELYFTATSGGKAEAGQIIRYRPSPNEGQAGEKDEPGKVTLFLESANENVFDYGDNLTISNWGHLFVCEDRYSDSLRNHIRIVTPQGKVATFARNVFKENGEWAGACFSPDGSTLFVNVQWPGFTLAITGPWQTFKV
ncbi:alkaline phosphatase PhoX [Asticcacaulis machinosus]|uniref:DUF839 domain-containing protein n=1 Tax=Asticcacaulis machinosus TaxID=2984211 RepID=A0ABT5HF17_9CAUL|nr:alkaline phosphatase PhoX [Asticcacaulis machinosus]MDC7674772.1 DUF839 domain-containing protein [Asticcacaulis machinosus]